MTSHPIRRVISGGQSGADQGFLFEARAQEIPTGGWAPRGFRTEYGNRPDLGSVFGLQEHPSRDYPPRTLCNIRDSDGTLIVTSATGRERGSILTKELCLQFGKPVMTVLILNIRADEVDPWITPVRNWILSNNIYTLNGAGNRESVTHGICGWTRYLLRRILLDWQDPIV